jgi:hypothetical protein
MPSPWDMKNGAVEWWNNGVMENGKKQKRTYRNIVV